MLVNDGRRTFFEKTDKPQPELTDNAISICHTVITKLNEFKLVSIELDIPSAVIANIT